MSGKIHREVFCPVKFWSGGEERTRWVKLGVTFLAKDTQKEVIRLDALPMRNQRPSCLASNSTQV